MEKLFPYRAPTPTINPCLISPKLSIHSKFKCSSKKKRVLVVRAARERGGSNGNNNNGKKLSEWDLMELKFGRMLGEDPDLTLAKIKGRKLNPDASYLEIEKNFYKNKGKLVETKEVPFEVPARWGSVKTENELNLVKPVPKKGIKVEGGENSVKLPEIKRPNELTRSRISRDTNYSDVDNCELLETKKPVESSGNKMGSVSKSNVPNVILRKPSSYNEKDDEGYNSRLRIKPNLSLPMRTEPVLEKFGGMTLLKKPDSVKMNEDHGDGTEDSMMNESVHGERDNFEDDMLNGGQSFMPSSGELELLKKPKAITPPDVAALQSTFRSNGMAETAGSFVDDSPESKSVLRSNQDQATNSSNTGKEIGTSKTARAGASGSGSVVGSVLQGRPSRLDRTVKELPRSIREDTVSTFSEGLDYQDEQDNLLLSRPLEEVEEKDWERLEQHFILRDRVDVELISCSPRGFVASFGSLIGFLPYRNLAAKWKFLAFESWLRKNGLDPSKYRQNLGIIGNDGVSNSNSSVDTLLLKEHNSKAEFRVTPNMELEDLLRIYDEEKIQYLSSYIGEQIKVNILLADRKSRKLIFSMRPKEKEESIERKRSLMAKLSIGDVVKCCIKKITYFGIFVEVEGVPALIHQSEVSWDATLDPSSYLKIGQIVDAKVHQLNFALERIFLSLKEISPDPLNEALECIVGNNSFDGGLQAAQADLEWAAVESLVKELQEVEGVQMVTKGRFFLSPGLAPTFQVYMASMFENQYKLLARSGNKVQEVMVETSLDKEDMKSAILSCTNRVQL